MQIVKCLSLCSDSIYQSSVNKFHQQDIFTLFATRHYSKYFLSFNQTTLLYFFNEFFRHESKKLRFLTSSLMQFFFNVRVCVLKIESMPRNKWNKSKSTHLSLLHNFSFKKTFLAGDIKIFTFNKSSTGSQQFWDFLSFPGWSEGFWVSRAVFDDCFSFLL